MADAPLSIALAVRKPRTLAGEGIVLDVRIEVRNYLKMETVELNRGRTEVLVSALRGGDFGNRVLTGEDFMVLHRHPPLQPVGTAFEATSGSAWTVQLELGRFTRPLPVGGYRIELTYRFGPRPEDVVQSNAVTVEIAKAKALQVEHRWLGGANARDRLGSLWLAEGPDGVRWFHQIARAHDASVIDSATDLDMPEVEALGPARLAHINDIAAMHFERFALWPAKGGMGFIKVHPYGRSGDPAVVPLPLAEKPAPRLIEPPLQTRAGVLNALWLGESPEGKPAVVWVELDAEGQAKQRTFALAGPAPLAAVAAWSRGEEPLAATVFLPQSGEKGIIRLVAMQLPEGGTQQLHESEAELSGLEIDQWMGFAWLHLLAHEREKQPAGEIFERLRISRWNVDDRAVSPEKGWTVPLGEGRTEEERLVSLLLPELRQAVSLPDGAGLALLFEKKDGWMVWTPRGRRRIAPPAHEAPERAQLVATPRDGVHFFFYEPTKGFGALPIP